MVGPLLKIYFLKNKNQIIMALNNSMVAHSWYNQQSRNGELSASGSNFFFENKTLFSYGYHFIVAFHCEGAIFFNTKGYSNSTSMHQSHAANAIDYTSDNVFRMPLKNCSRYENRKPTFKHVDFEAIKNTLAELFQKLSVARKPELYLDQIRGQRKLVFKYFERFRGAKTYAKKTKGLFPLLYGEIKSVSESAKKGIEKRRKEEKLRKKRLQAEQKRQIKAWINGDAQSCNVNNNLTLIRPARDGEHMETTRGVKISIRACKKIYNFWINGKVVGLTVTTKSGYDYTCTAANGTIKFGCHLIEKEHAEYWAKKLNW